MSRLGCYAAMLLVALSALAAFQRPSEEQSLEAIGNRFEEETLFRRLITPDEDFTRITVPGPNDWLGSHLERGQTFDNYRASLINRPNANRHTIYLLPMSDFPNEASPELAQLIAYASAFFQMRVKVLPTYSAHELEFEPRQNPHNSRRQLHTTSILEFLKTRLPDDAFCLLGITMEDLYPHASWNYVFGQASLRERVGIYSFCRYDPVFWNEARGPRYQETILRRSVKVLVHEAAHMFGLLRCIYFNCAMNGSNHLEESDARPQHLCPVCLRKMKHAIRFDAVVRYEDLARFYHKQKWYEEADWVERQLARTKEP